MKSIATLVITILLASGCCYAEESFVVTGTPIPANLLRENYGRAPKNIGGFDLNICNVTQTRQSVMSSAIYQALAQSNVGLQPIGRQIMLAAILRSQSRSFFSFLNVGVSSATGTLSILSSSKYGVPTGVLTGAAIGSIVLQQVLTNVKPMLSADQLEKFDNQVLEPALILDAGSCVERTVFTLITKPAAQDQHLNFHVR